MRLARQILIWVALLTAIAIPVGLAAMSPQLAWRNPIYIASGFAGIIAMALMILQPLLAAGYLPGLPALRGRRIHRMIGGMLVAAVVAHVLGLWITSPPDVVDALLFVSPPPFYAWGVIAMWAKFLTAILAAIRRRLRLRWRTWRLGHSVLALVIVLGTVVHALLIEGTMEAISKVTICMLLIAITLKVLADLRVWAKRATLR